MHYQQIACGLGAWRGSRQRFQWSEKKGPTLQVRFGNEIMGERAGTYVQVTLAIPVLFSTTCCRCECCGCEWRLRNGFRAFNFNGIGEAARKMADRSKYMYCTKKTMVGGDRSNSLRSDNAVTLCRRSEEGGWLFQCCLVALLLLII